MYPKALNLHPALLRPNPWNSNHVSPDNEAKLEASIKRHGMFKPVLVRELDGGYQILGGQHRASIATRLHIASIPVSNLGPIDEKAAKEIGLLDNARYGADDVLSLQQILTDLGTAHELAMFLPYTDREIDDILIVADNISLDDLDTEEDDRPGSESDEPDDLPKVPKTHAVMRFKVPLGDMEWVSTMVADTQKRQGFTTEDELTNAGDALVHLLRASR